MRRRERRGRREGRAARGSAGRQGAAAPRAVWGRLGLRGRGAAGTEPRGWSRAGPARTPCPLHPCSEGLSQRLDLPGREAGLPSRRQQSRSPVVLERFAAASSPSATSLLELCCCQGTWGWIFALQKENLQLL